MAKPMSESEGTKPLPTGNGIFVRGIVVSNRARAIKRKDGTGTLVLVEHEIALQPGVATWARFLDPKTDPGVKVEGENVTEFPKLADFQSVTIKAGKVGTDGHSGQLVIRSGELAG